LPKLNQPLNVCFSKGCGKDIALDTDEWTELNSKL
jgi:hypothetical protein